MAQGAVPGHGFAIGAGGDGDDAHAALLTFQRDIQRHGIYAIGIDQHHDLAGRFPNLVGVEHGDAVSRHAFKAHATLGAMDKTGTGVDDGIPRSQAPGAPEHLLRRHHRVRASAQHVHAAVLRHGGRYDPGGFFQRLTLCRGDGLEHICHDPGIRC